MPNSGLPRGSHMRTNAVRAMESGIERFICTNEIFGMYVCYINSFPAKNATARHKL